MSLLLALITSPPAVAAPTPALCQRWARQVHGSAATAMSQLHTVEDPRVRGLSGSLKTGPVQAEVRNGVCHISATGVIDLDATLTVATPLGGEVACAVTVRDASVPLGLSIGGSAKAPQVQSSTLPVQLLGPHLRTCLAYSWVSSAVVSVAARWVAGKQGAWHRELESWLAASASP